MSLFYKYKNILLLFLLSLIWSLHFSLVKIVEADNNPLSILIPLLFILCIFFYCILLLKKQLFKITIRKCIFFSLAGIFAYIVPLSIGFIVAPKIEVGILTIIISIVPIFTLLIIWLFRLLKVTTKLVIGTFFGLFGISILLIGNDYNNTSLNIWVIFALIIPLSYAFDAIFMEKFWPKNLNTLQVAFGECFASLIFVILLSFFLENEFYHYYQWFLLPSFWVLAIVTFIEVWLFFYVLSNFGAVFVNLGSYLVMPAGFAWGYIFFGENFTLLKLISTLLIIISILLIGNQKYKIKNIPIE